MNLIELLAQDGFQMQRKTGDEYGGPCPKCGGQDRFLAWPEKGNGGRFHCLRGCGWQGDGIQYLRDYRGIFFEEAAAIMGKENNMGSCITSGERRNTETLRNNNNGTK